MHTPTGRFPPPPPQRFPVAVMTPGRGMDPPPPCVVANGRAGFADAAALTAALDVQALTPYATAADNAGLVYVSESLTTRPPRTPAGDAAAVRAAWAADHAAFMADAGRPEFRVPTVAGAPLDIFALYAAVLRLGGLHSVMANRAFKLVARQLALPKSCTSAAYVLRTTYERLLFDYEQAAVWGRRPPKPPPGGVDGVGGVGGSGGGSRGGVDGPGGGWDGAADRAAGAAATPGRSSAPPAAGSRPKRQAALAASSGFAADAAAASGSDG